MLLLTDGDPVGESPGDADAAPAEAASPGPEAVRAADAPAAPPRVLVVEDDPSTLRAMLALFARFGLAPESASTVAEARAKLTAPGTPPAFVVLDLMLPDGNGIEVLRLIRAGGRPVKVAVVTGVFDWHLLDDVRKLGPERLFQKPVDAPKLIQWLTGQ